MKTNMLASAMSLSNQDLLDRLVVLAGNERHASVELIAHLAALQDRPSLYEGLGFGSLFDYCTGVLRLSEDATCTRTAVAGACRRFPVILDLLATGATNLTNIRRLAGKLTPENHEAILARAVHRTREEIEVLLRELDPLPDLRSSVRKVAAPAGVGSPPTAPAQAPSQASIDLPPAEAGAPAAFAPPGPRPVVRPSAPQRYHVKFTIGEETHRKLRRVQTLLRREIPDGDPGAIFDRALALLLEKVERAEAGGDGKTAASDRLSVPERMTRSPGASRHIPSEVKRAVSKRDADQCAFVSPEGRRCTQRAFLEFHHVQPFGHQGPATTENISLRCRAHNVYESELIFGPFDPSVVRETPENYLVTRKSRAFRHSPGIVLTDRVSGRGRATGDLHAGRTINRRSVEPFGRHVTARHTPIPPRHPRREEPRRWPGTKHPARSPKSGAAPPSRAATPTALA